MRVPKVISEFLIANKDTHGEILSSELRKQFNYTMTPRQISRHLSYKKAKVSKRSKTYMDIPSELSAVYPDHYAVTKNGVWVIRPLRGSVNGYTTKLMSRALLEHRYGITLTRYTNIIHMNGNTSDMSEGNILPVPYGVYSRLRQGGIDISTTPYEVKCVKLIQAWSEHFTALSKQYRKERRDDVRSEIAKQIQSDHALYDICKRSARITNDSV